MIFAVIVGAQIFTKLFCLASLPDAVADLDAGILAVLLATVVIYLLLGCVRESLSTILFTVPAISLRLVVGTG